MKAWVAAKLLDMYGTCPDCGCGKVGNGKGSIVITDNTFRRTCACGYDIVLEVRGYDIVLDEAEVIQNPDQQEDIYTHICQKCGTQFHKKGKIVILCDRCKRGVPK